MPDEYEVILLPMALPHDDAKGEELYEITKVMLDDLFAEADPVLVSNLAQTMRSAAQGDQILDDRHDMGVMYGPVLGSILRWFLDQTGLAEPASIVTMPESPDGA